MTEQARPAPRKPVSPPVTAPVLNQSERSARTGSQGSLGRRHPAGSPASHIMQDALPPPKPSNLVEVCAQQLCPAPHGPRRGQGDCPPCAPPTPGVLVNAAGGTPVTNTHRQLSQAPPTWHQATSFPCPGVKRTPDEQAAFHGRGLLPPSQRVPFLAKDHQPRTPLPYVGV